MDREKSQEHTANDDPVSLAPLSAASAMRALLAIPDPEATKPKHAKAKRNGPSGG